ncbi:MAG: 4Fe-4S binding protein [Melioribacteraceae bacterium]|nr:4Fe-4S binding protein [Melioribacteraceae bacterium]MCF8263721.1 4Fe-4S binding protein [Melioribacteraceae bacterium]MCF8431742.1 4Fe-4S binding protein [Melioribacteraceae bacterium]
MLYSKLKLIRKFVALFFILITASLFLDIHNLFVEDAAELFLFFQFIPSILKFIISPGFIAAGFLVVLVLTILYGRVYCSFICPLGILMDIIRFIKRKLLKVKREKFRFEKPFDKTRYSFLGLVLLLIGLGSLFGIVILDPYSNFGRIVTQLLRPIFVFANNGTVLLLEQGEIYSLKPIALGGWQPVAFFFSFFFLGLIIYLVWKKGRLYCNLICPVGTFLGLISKLSIFKIAVDESTCTGCGVCEKVCKSNCIKSDEKYIDFSRCVGCFNCFDACPTVGLIYNPSLSKIETKELKTDNSKRNFLFSIGAFIASSSLVTKAQEKINVYIKNEIPVNRVNPISPPGSLGIDHMKNHCTACELCVSACPTNVLQPSFLEYGFTGMMMPRMDNFSGFCNYDCKICGDVCPTGAILPNSLEGKKLVQVGKAKFIKDNCVVYTQKTDCGACAEHCPTKAVKMVLDPEVNLRAPVVTEEYCVGCGACEHICPTIPYKSIWVESNVEHLAAKFPEQEKLEDVSIEEEFPF